MDYADIVKMKIRKKDVPAVCGCISAFIFIILMLISGIGYAVLFIPVLCAAPLLAFVSVKQKKGIPHPEIIMNESPAAIGIMRLMINSNSSLDSAVREVAENGPRNIAKMFRKIVWDVDTRVSSDIRISINSMIAALPDQLAAFKRSMYLIISASDSPNPDERARITKDANDTILDGLKQMGESYSSRLNAPCMVIFGLGVMVPMILVSVLPMLSIGGQFSSASLDPIMIAIITLLVIPGIVAGVIIMIASKNPFYVRSDEKLSIGMIISVSVCVPVFASLFFMTNDLTISLAASAIASGLSLFVMLHPVMIRERKKVRIESAMGTALFDLGNRLLAGGNFEAALISSFKERKDCAEFTGSLERCIMLCRGDTEQALRLSMSVYSKKMALMYIDIYKSSLKDLRDAGRLAISMGHQLQDQTATVNGIQNKLRSMLDMMTGTSAVFAPLILGISVSMLAPLAGLAGGSDMSFTSPILMAYLIELAVLISVLTTQLKCRGGLLTSLYSFSIMMPAALIIFMVSSNFMV
ncbi:MAG: hypothetical protein LBE48_05575 [Methanomassiliicoccaceae archaeon]|jgi:hypothetical protein|nr:hypothetical protein [Methanomassiliicoccaceae archaeon]